MSKKTQYNPDYATHPGEVLLEILVAREIKPSNLAAHCGISEENMREILRGKADIEPHVADKLEQVLGISAQIWLGLDGKYKDFNQKELNGL